MVKNVEFEWILPIPIWLLSWTLLFKFSLPWLKISILTQYLEFTQKYRQRLQKKKKGAITTDFNPWGKRLTDVESVKTVFFSFVFVLALITPV